MHWLDILCIVLVVLGVMLFLYGSNVYDQVFGFGGIGLFVFGVLLYIATQVFKRKAKSSEPVKT